MDKELKIFVEKKTCLKLHDISLKWFRVYRKISDVLKKYLYRFYCFQEFT